jgi:hypothetical protein
MHAVLLLLCNVLCAVGVVQEGDCWGGDSDQDAGGGDTEGGHLCHAQGANHHLQQLRVLGDSASSASVLPWWVLMGHSMGHHVLCGQTCCQECFCQGPFVGVGSIAGNGYC